jgi:hypothetical protein
MESHLHIKWLDNFSHTWANGLACTKLDQAYHECLWTGVGLHVYEPSNGTGIIKSIKIRPNQPATDDLPSFCNASVVKDLLVRMHGLVEDDFGRGHLICQRYHQNLVPIKLVKDERMSKDELLTCDQRARDSLDDFQPLDMLEINIGSNVGLMRVLLKTIPGLHPDEPDCATHEIINSDCNIYVRIAKVSE